MRNSGVAPLYHSAPAAYALYSVNIGESDPVHPRLDPERLLADIERHRLTHLYLVATHYVRLLRLPDDVRRRYDLSRLSSSPRPARHARRRSSAP